MARGRQRWINNRLQLFLVVTLYHFSRTFGFACRLDILHSPGETPSMFHRYDIVDEKDLNASVAKLAKALQAAQG